MRRILSLLCVLTLSVSLTSCGKNSSPIVSEIGVDTIVDGGDQLVSADFKLAIGNAELPFLDLPLPKNYGALRLYRLNGENRVTVDANLTEILKVPAGQATLPNGNPVPVDTMGAGVITIDIEGVSAKVYVAQTNGVTLIGFAIAIKQLDGLGSSIGNAGLFPNFNIGKVNLTAGVFTSDEQKQTGIAAFANLAGLWSNSVELSSNKEMFAPVAQRKLSRRQKRRLYKGLKRMMKKRQVLTISEE